MYQSAPMSASCSGSWPGACAPSTITSTPRARQTAAMSLTGSTMEVGDVRWSSSTKRMRGWRARQLSSSPTSASSEGSGSGRSSVSSSAPDRSHVCRAAFAHALYVWSRMSNASPGPSRSEPSTAFTAVVALSTNTSAPGAAPKKRPTVSAASFQDGSAVLLNHSSGHASMASACARAAAVTSSGATP